MNEIPIEAERGCGYRVVGKLYLVGTGFSMPCDNLPYPLVECNCCGYAPQFSRNLQWFKKSYIEQHEKEVEHWGEEDCDGKHEWLGITKVECKCRKHCPICYPDSNDLEKYALMWVGEQHYTSESFLLEANKMGVSKAIPNIPKDLKLGETWIFLAHRKVKIGAYSQSGDDLIMGYIEAPAIFYGFIPRAIEMLIWKSEATEEKIEELKSKDITPIIVEDGDEAHGNRNRRNE